ncbi:hypothetical protein [Methylobacterium sp. WL6]|uniref:hypothetical protein n=1 Tax=Methylobacterium sp. WL6 TaxID=2603901 RepID=UPI0011CB9FB8|nr:hypothetical protein [Methylobacterium sp. WL6]TXN71890.1 hypothetical protein FV230_06820 [Methylobacterium sp. WL6]
MSNPAGATDLMKLSALAASLGIPVERFFADDEATERLAGASECARLWDLIKTVEGRRHALAYLRGLADEPNS